MRDRIAAGDWEGLASGQLRKPGGDLIVIDAARLSGAFSALVIGGDVDIANQTGENAAKYNSLGLIRKAFNVSKVILAKWRKEGKLPEGQDLRDAIFSAEDAAVLFGADSSNGDRVLAALTLAIDWFSPISVSEMKQLKAALGKACPNGKCKLPGGTCSFRGDTQVLTSLGYKRIDAIKPGDSVWSRDDRTGQMAFQSVLHQYSNPYKDTVYITIRDTQTALQQTIVSNRIHPFFVQRQDFASNVHLASTNSEGHIYRGKIKGGAWVDADQLQSGDRLLQADEEWSEVVSVSIVAEPLKAYNVTVAHSETFYVRAGDASNADAVWVHNCWRKYISKRKWTNETGEYMWVNPFTGKFEKVSEAGFRGSVSGDHLLSRKEMSTGAMAPYWNKLTSDERKAFERLSSNFMPMPPSINASKGS